MRYLATLPAVIALGLIGQACTAQSAPADDTLPKTRIERAEEGSARKSLFDDPLGGVVVNRTVTVLGNDFYREFASRWREKDISDRFSISIHERPSARFGSEVWVLYRQKQVFRTFLPPARAATEDISVAAVEIVYQSIVDSEVERAMFKSADLGPEEL